MSSVMQHLDNHHILSDCQHGFRAKKSFETQLLSLYHELANGLDKSKKIDLIILDFSKASDWVRTPTTVCVLNLTTMVFADLPGDG